MKALIPKISIIKKNGAHLEAIVEKTEIEAEVEVEVEAEAEDEVEAEAKTEAEIGRAHV